MRSPLSADMEKTIFHKVCLHNRITIIYLKIANCVFP